MPLRLKSMNHISRVCKDVEKTKEFYQSVLGFVEVLRPSQLEDNLEGSWLFNYNIGIHLIQGTPLARSDIINPKNDHLSFQCESFQDVVTILHNERIPFVKEIILHERMYEIHQVFFLDPDRNMIEICTCECMPVTPLVRPSKALFKSLSHAELVAAFHSPDDVDESEYIHDHDSVPMHADEVLSYAG